MVKNVALDIETHRRLRRIAKRRRWSLKVAVDEAIRAFEIHGSTPSYEVESFMTAGQRDSGPSATNEQQDLSPEGLDTRDASANS